jgi:hypothetical protein
VVLDVLKRAVLGEFVQKGLDWLFGGGHYEVKIAWRPQNPGLAKVQKQRDLGAPGSVRETHPCARTGPPAVEVKATGSDGSLHRPAREFLAV